ncbi:unnamed protein product, partial [Brenthis ino]
MNFAVLCVLLAISETNSHYITDTRLRIEGKYQSVLLRKLQNFQDYDPRNTTQAPNWSEILADVLVKRIFTFHKTSNETEHLTSVEDSETSVWVRSVSCILKLFKTYIYDRVLGYVESKVDKNVSKIKRNITERDPKEEVEIIEPKYHGKLCENCTESSEIEADVSDCGNGLKKDPNGNCVDPKSSKFILSIPSQCPTGYRRDWFGYCRATL